MQEAVLYCCKASHLQPLPTEDSGMQIALFSEYPTDLIFALLVSPRQRKHDATTCQSNNTDINVSG